VLSRWAAIGTGATSWVRDACDTAETRRRRGGTAERIAEVALGQPLGQPPTEVLDALADYVAITAGASGAPTVALRVFADSGTEALATGVRFAQRSGGFVNASATMHRMLLLLDSWEVDTSEHRRRLDHAESVEQAIGVMGEPAMAGVSTA
jgi:hypothetical protein